MLVRVFLREAELILRGAVFESVIKLQGFNAATSASTHNKPEARMLVTVRGPSSTSDSLDESNQAV